MAADTPKVFKVHAADKPVMTRPTVKPPRQEGHEGECLRQPEGKTDMHVTIYLGAERKTQSGNEKDLNLATAGCWI